MFSNILHLMRCLICCTDLRLVVAQEQSADGEIISGIVECQQGHVWPVEEGVLVFSREDALSDPWSKSYKTYDQYVRLNTMWIPAAAQEAAPILDSIPPSPSGPHLDACTGSGGLLFNLLKKRKPNTTIISVDMSLHVQKFNRRYRMETFGDYPVSFVSCDAAVLPFKKSVFSCVTSWAMGNMLDRFPSGIKEAARVLDTNGVFIFSHLYVREDSEGWRTLGAGMAELGIADYGFLGLEQDFVRLMERSGFRRYEIEVSREVIGDPNRDTESGPLFPYPNEPLRELLVKAWN